MSIIKNMSFLNRSKILLENDINSAFLFIITKFADSIVNNNHKKSYYISLLLGDHYFFSENSYDKSYHSCIYKFINYQNNCISCADNIPRNKFICRARYANLCNICEYNHYKKRNKKCTVCKNCIYVNKFNKCYKCQYLYYFQDVYLKTKPIKN